jgi:hypothetical protein
MSEKIFYVDKKNSTIHEMLNEYMNDERDLHYMIMADISNGSLRKIDVDQFSNDYYILTSYVLDTDKNLRKKYFKNLKTGMEFDFKTSSKVSHWRTSFKKKYPDEDEKQMGFKK